MVTVSLLSSTVLWGKETRWTGPLFPHLLLGINERTYPVGLLRGLNELCVPSAKQSDWHPASVQCLLLLLLSYYCS